MNCNYGYFNRTTNKFQNDQLIECYCDGIKDQMNNIYKTQLMDVIELAWNSKLTIKSSVDNYNGPNFNTLVIYHPIAAGIIEYYDGLDYLIDFYGIRFVYDSKINPWKCVLTVEGKFYDGTKYCQKGNGNIFTIENLGELYRFEGTFDQCFDKLKELLDGLVKINEKN